MGTAEWSGESVAAAGFVQPLTDALREDVDVVRRVDALERDGQGKWILRRVLDRVLLRQRAAEEDHAVFEDFAQLLVFEKAFHVRIEVFKYVQLSSFKQQSGVEEIENRRVGMVQEFVFGHVILVFGARQVLAKLG